MRALCHQREGSLYHAHTDGPPCDVPPSPDISHPEFCPADVPSSPDISHLALDAGCERRAFQLPWSNISESADSTHPEDFTAILHSADSVHPENFATNFAQCRGVLLKLPDMCNRHFEIFFFRYFEIFFFRYLMSNPESLLVTHLS